MLLRELEAFEACWLDLKDQYPTSCQDNTLIARAMGQIVDLVEKPDQVERSLPDHLKILFRRLAIAYFQGYIPRRSQPVPAKPVRTVTSPSAVTAPAAAPAAAAATAVKAPSEYIQKQEISAAVEQVRKLAQLAQARIRQSRVSHDCAAPTGCSIEDMDTLIVDFPESWQVDG